MSARPVLLVDIGNTRTHWAVYDGEWRVGVPLPTGEAARLGSLCRAQHGCLPGIGVVCCVVPGALDGLEATLAAANVQVLVLGRSIQASMPVGYHDPGQLGPDRLANAVAAFERYRGAAIVVDAGTAVTVDAVSEEGAFLGGAIAPGPRLALKGLADGVGAGSFTGLDAAWLAGRPSAPPSAIGHSTEECLEAGLRLGLAGLIDRLIAEQRAELGTHAPVIWTGGAAPSLRPSSTEPGDLDELLTLRGLKAIYDSQC
jgi:type III pantothenate kinase